MYKVASMADVSGLHKDAIFETDYFWKSSWGRENDKKNVSVKMEILEQLKTMQ